MPLVQLHRLLWLCDKENKMLQAIKNFFGTADTPAGNTYEMKVDAPVIQVPTGFAPPVMFVPGKWIVWKESIRGILVSIDTASGGKMDQVDDAGVTIGTVQITMADIRLARYTEIPAPRRPADPLWAATKGYC
jgi:hypothetical protein